MLLAFGLVSPASAAATNTWVSGVGDDANPCSRTAPCKTFAGAISKTEAGGIIHVLDPGPYNPVTIVKSITIDASESVGSMIIGANGVVVNAPATARVVLRGLDMFASQAASATCSPTQQAGVRVLSAGSVVIEDSRINLAATGGVQVTPTVNPVSVSIVDSVIRNSCGPAVRVAPGAGVTASAAVLDSTLSLNAVGLVAETGGTVSMQGSTLFGNAVATEANGGTIDISDPGNRVIGNAAVSNPILANTFANVTRSWVSGVGDDVNPCSRTAPCKTIAGAYLKTSSGGQINVLDPAPLGQLTITRPITIDGTGSNSIVFVTSNSGITVDVAGTEPVVLRNLRIIGTNNGAAGCSYPAVSGVRVLNGRSVHIENSAISGFSTAGVNVAPSSTNPRIVIDKSTISNVCGPAVRLAPAGGVTATALVHRSSLVNNGTAVSATAGGEAWVSRSYLANNDTATSGPVTVLPDTVEVVKEVQKEIIKEVPVTVPVTPVAQSPVACKKLPGRLKRKRTTVILANTCVTTGGQRVSVQVSGAGKAVRGANGRVSVRTKKKGKVTIRLSAPATPAFLSFQQSKTYTL